VKNLFLILFLIVFSQAKAANVNTLSVNSIFADKSLSTLISLQPTLTDILYKTDLDISVDAAKFRNQVNYNSAVEDFIIEKTFVSAGLDISWNRMLTLGVAGSTENVNQNEVRVSGITSKIRLKAFDFALKATLNDRYIRQVADYIVLNNNIKDKLTLRSTKKTFSLSYYGFQPFSFSFSHSKYDYDMDPTSAITLLSGQAVLQNHGASFLSQIYSLVDYENTLDIVYNATEKLDIEMMLGQTVDFLEPHVKSNEYRLGATYYFNIFNLGAGITGVKAEDTDETLYSGDLTLSYEF
jgi:hypothetical protein